MKQQLKNLTNKYLPKRRQLIVEESNVLNVLRVINSRNRNYFNQHLMMNNCGWAEEPDKWFIYFDASDDSWVSIMESLEAKGFALLIKYGPRDIFVTKKYNLAL